MNITPRPPTNISAHIWSQMTDREKYLYFSGRELELVKKRTGENLGEFTQPYYRTTCGEFWVSEWVTTRKEAYRKGEEYIASLNTDDWPDYFGIGN